MHSVILVAEAPEHRSDNSIPHEASHAIQAAEQLYKEHGSTYAGIQRLGVYAWLLPLRDGLPFLNLLASIYHKGGLSYRVLYLEKEPDWHSFSPVKTTNS